MPFHVSDFEIVLLLRSRQGIKCVSFLFVAFATLSHFVAEIDVFLFVLVN